MPEVPERCAEKSRLTHKKALFLQLHSLWPHLESVPVKEELRILGLCGRLARTLKMLHLQQTRCRGIRIRI